MSNVKFAARVLNYAEAAEFLGDKWERKIGYATWVKRSTTNPHLISLIHHETAIITWADGMPDVAIIDTGSYVSRTTANRLHYFTPNEYRIGSRITNDESHYTIVSTETWVSDLNYDGYGSVSLYIGRYNREGE